MQRGHVFQTAKADLKGCLRLCKYCDSLIRLYLHFWADDR
uniref:Uncharacterized protein n=1 Tax=Rhizophora mucronata TaxID=61149 RepID=A0A2P2R2V8_RHIMU